MSKTYKPYLFFRFYIFILGIQFKCKKGSCNFSAKIFEATVGVKCPVFETNYGRISFNILQPTLNKDSSIKLYLSTEEMRSEGNEAEFDKFGKDLIV